eukprot:2696635-Prymnesium_polylepis.1
MRRSEVRREARQSERRRGQVRGEARHKRNSEGECGEVRCGEVRSGTARARACARACMAAASLSSKKASTAVWKCSASSANSLASTSVKPQSAWAPHARAREHCNGDASHVRSHVSGRAAAASSTLLRCHLETCARGAKGARRRPCDVCSNSCERHAHGKCCSPTQTTHTSTTDAGPKNGACARARGSPAAA